MRRLAHRRDNIRHASGGRLAARLRSRHQRDAGRLAGQVMSSPGVYGSDIVLLVVGEPLYAHRIVLSKRSPVFAGRIQAEERLMEIRPCCTSTSRSSP